MEYPPFEWLCRQYLLQRFPSLTSKRRVLFPSPPPVSRIPVFAIYSTPTILTGRHKIHTPWNAEERLV